MVPPGASGGGGESQTTYRSFPSGVPTGKPSMRTDALISVDVSTGAKLEIEPEAQRC